jgi:hypothetical protein
LAQKEANTNLEIMLAIKEQEMKAKEAEIKILSQAKATVK